jgi:hypothetical protein
MASTQVDNLLDRKAVRQHDRLGAAVGGISEQSERAATLGLETGESSRFHIAFMLRGATLFYCVVSGVHARTKRRPRSVSLYSQRDLIPTWI